ncbi:MAG: glycogen debranching protein GlgX [Alphaproteobacteria bacterium]|jgi:glycogen operon protein|nr:glycogen debranching protein GlgX [Alphaproteobacteria bacterium]
MAAYTVSTGAPHPLGATPTKTGVNFSLFSQHATGVELLLFDSHDAPDAAQTIVLDPVKNNSFFFWHVHVDGLKPGAFYAYRVDGPNAPEEGHRFNRNKVLVDPYARGITHNLLDRGAACTEDDNVAKSMRSIVVDPAAYDWGDDAPPRKPIEDHIIYEMHVGGFTAAANSGVSAPGTFQGVIEKLPYLKDLGVTAIELLPIHSFDYANPLRSGPDGQPLYNYWGYSTIGFFAPVAKYCTRPNEARQLDDVRDLVKACHKEGIEVFLDVVYNHTDEGNHQGPVFNFKGIDNSLYYHLVKDNPYYYMDYTGCGNTFNCNHPVGEKLVVESLKYWTTAARIDGFRFDEGTILTRGMDGAPMAYPPLVWDIELDDTLLDVKVIAEAWDAAGAYEVGYFPGDRWAEWNGKYRDDIRSFVKGDPGQVGAVAARIAGSADLYQWRQHRPENSVNFITCHDGFTLNDLVSYDGKHNEANGENNNDGINDNVSWNCGVEGPTDDAQVEALRNRQVKNFAALLMLSQGVPMITMGDEVRRTQGGNNNTYCQDNAIAWFNWDDVDRHADVFRFFKHMIAFRKAHATLRRPRFFTGETNERGLKDIAWHGTSLAQPAWDDPQARALAFTLAGFGDDPDIHVMMNMYWEALDFALPGIWERTWHRFADTALDSPKDIAEPGQEIPVSGSGYTVTARSVVILTAK